MSNETLFFPRKQMISDEAVNIIALSSVVILCIFLFVMFYQLLRGGIRKKLPTKKGGTDVLARQVSSEIFKELKPKLFSMKEFALITIALGVASALVGTNVEMAKAIITVDGFMISFAVVSWSIVIRQVSKQSYRHFRDRLSDLAEDKDLIKELAKGRMPTDEEATKALISNYATPLLQRALVGKAFPQAITAFVVSTWSSLVLLGFRFDITSPIWGNVYGFVQWSAAFFLMFGIYSITKVFSLSEEILFDADSYLYETAIKKWIKSIDIEKRNSHSPDSEKT